MREQDEHPDPQEVARRLQDLLAGKTTEDAVSDELTQCLRQAMLLDRAQAGDSWTVNADDPCPGEEIWTGFAAGQREAEADLLLGHAARCHRCAARLRDAMNRLNEEETAMLPLDLANSTPAWQSAMGRHLTQLMPAKAKPRRVLSFPRPLSLAIAAGLLIAIAGASFFLWRSRHSARDADAALLARAYDQQRLTALRIPGGHDVPLASFTRGERTAHIPADLSELNTQVERRLKETPNDAEAQQMLGRIDLLQANPLLALDDFQKARDLAGSRQALPGIDADVADAWFELAEKSGLPDDYSRAANSFTIELNHRPADRAVVLYNRGLCFERQGLLDAATADFKEALTAEAMPEWRKTIQDHLDRLKPHAEAGTAPAFETALGTALSGLPGWDASATSRAAFAQTAALGLTHKDHWLADWIAAPHTVRSRLADQQLADASAAIRVGRYADLLTDSLAAGKLYALASNRAGEVRARQLQVYALQRLGRAADCRQAAERLGREPVLAVYPVLFSQLLVDEGGCASRLEDFATAATAFRRADDISTQAGLSLARVRAEGSQAEMLADSGNASAAWRQSVMALGLCRTAVCNSGQHYLLLSILVDIAQQNGQQALAAVLMKTAIANAPSTTAINHAYAVENLATLEGNAGDFAGSERDFAKAFTLANSGGNHLTALYTAVWQTDQAQVLTLEGRPEEALRLLAQGTPKLFASDYGPGRVQAYSQLAQTQLRAGRTAEALGNAQNAVHEAENALASLHTLFAREQWIRQNADVYAGLVDAELRSGENDAALRDWERFRSIPWANEPAYSASRKASLVTDAAAASTAAEVLVIARIHDHYVGWIARTHPFAAERTIVLGDRELLQAQAATFHRLCSDPGSSLEEVHAAGSLLYHSLLAPLDAGSQRPRHLWLDLDPSLQDLPFAALSLPSGAWLASEADLTELAPAWSLGAPRSLEEEQLVPSLNAVVLNGFSGSEAESSEALAVAHLFSHSRVVNSSSGTQSGLLSALDSAQLIHFSGHAQAGDTPALELAKTSLTPQLLAGLHLRSCRVAVLAACSTDEEGRVALEPPQGLRNALLDAGVHTVVVSNWDVENASTRALMLALYREAGLGVSVSHALRLAEQSIASTPQWQHPFYWAAFQSFTQ